MRKKYNNRLKLEVALQKEEETEESAAQNIKVDVKGAVKYGGVYDAQQGERVHDILKHAEVLPNADLEAVNLSQEVRDALVIYIPFKGEVKTDKYTLYQNTGGILKVILEATYRVRLILIRQNSLSLRKYLNWSEESAGYY